MDDKDIGPNPSKEVAVVVQKKDLVLEGDPQAQLAFAKKAADALMTVVSQKPKKVMIRGEQYLEFGDWQTLARFFGSTVGVEWTKPITEGTKVIGYEARAVVYRNAEIISSAEAMCMRVEKNWSDRDEFMLRSMAQTRASAKALRNAFGWVAELAGYKSTPAEEMGEPRYEPSYRRTNYGARAEMDIPPADVEEENNTVMAPVKPVTPPQDENDPQFMTEAEQEEFYKAEIKRYLKVLGKIPTPKAIMGLTGIKMIPENYKAILAELKSMV